jgi:hypothetical protein
MRLAGADIEPREVPVEKAHVSRGVPFTRHPGLSWLRAGISSHLSPEVPDRLAPARGPGPASGMTG